MAVLRADISELLKVDLDAVLFEELGTQGYEELLNAIYLVKDSKKRYEYGLTVGGFSLLPEKDEGADLGAREWMEGYKTTFEHKTFGMYSPITWEARQDELHGVVNDIPTAMSRAVAATMNYYASRIFSRANNSSTDFTTGGDGVALLSTAHPLKGGGTAANTPSSGVDLSVTSFWTEVNRFYEMLDDAGKPCRNRPDRLLIPHQLERIAVEILESPQRPDVTENAINALRERYRIRLVVWPYWIGTVDPDCWFLLAAKDQWPRDKYPLRFYWRARPQTETYNDFFTKDFMYSVILRFSLGFLDWRWISGSMGG